MAQNEHEILEDSNADILYTGEGHTYTGNFPISVDNDNDTISCDFKRFIAYDYDPNRQWRQAELCWHDDELYVCTNPMGAIGTWNDDYWSTTTVSDAIMATY